MIFIRKLLEPITLVLLAIGLSYASTQNAHAAGADTLPITELVKAIDDSQRRVWVAADHITHPELATALKQAFDRKVDVALLVRTPNKLGYNAGSYLARVGVPVYLHDARSSRPKNFIVIDDWALDLNKLRLSDLTPAGLGFSEPRTVPQRPLVLGFDEFATPFVEHFAALKKEAQPLVVPGRR